MKDGCIPWVNKQLYSQCWQQGFGCYNLSTDWGKDGIHLTKWNKYQVAKDLCQQAGQPGEESFKLGMKRQGGEIMMTHGQLKSLWTGLVRRCKVMLAGKTLKTVKQGRRGVQKSWLIFKTHFPQAQDSSTLMSVQAKMAEDLDVWAKSSSLNLNIKRKWTEGGNRDSASLAGTWPRRNTGTKSEHAGVELEKPKPIWGWIWEGP